MVDGIYPIPIGPHSVVAADPLMHGEAAHQEHSHRDSDYEVDSYHSDGVPIVLEQAGEKEGELVGYIDLDGHDDAEQGKSWQQQHFIVVLGR